MKLSSKTEYAIKALVHLAEQSKDVPCSLQEIAEAEQLSFSFLEKIFADLRKAEIVISHRGVNGGYTLAKPLQEISMKAIIESLEGEIQPFDSLVKQEGVPKIHCKSHLVLFMVQKKLQESFDSVTLQDLVQTA